MKRILLLLFALLLISVLNAASVRIGGEFGLTVDSVIAGSGYKDYQYSPSVGFKASVPLTVEFGRNIGVKTGITFIEKNYDYDRYVKEDDTTYHTNDLTRYNGFLEVPLSLLILFPLDSSASAFLLFGGFGGCWIYCRQKGNVLSTSSVKDTAVVPLLTDLSYYNRFQYGLLCSLGLDISWDRMSAVLSFEYALSLSDMNKRQRYGSYPIYNSAFTLSLALMGKI